MSCAPPSGWAVAEWTVDAGKLVMGGQGSGIFSAGTIVSVSSYTEYREGGLSLPGRVFFFGSNLRYSSCSCGNVEIVEGSGSGEVIHLNQSTSSLDKDTRSVNNIFTKNMCFMILLLQTPLPKDNTSAGRNPCGPCRSRLGLFGAGSSCWIRSGPHSIRALVYP
jgi:hypothetical protein